MCRPVRAADSVAACFKQNEFELACALVAKPLLDTAACAGCDAKPRNETHPGRAK